MSEETLLLRREGFPVWGPETRELLSRELVQSLIAVPGMRLVVWRDMARLSRNVSDEKTPSAEEAEEGTFQLSEVSCLCF